MNLTGVCIIIHVDGLVCTVVLRCVFGVEDMHSFKLSRMASKIQMVGRY